MHSPLDGSGCSSLHCHFLSHCHCHSCAHCGGCGHYGCGHYPHCDCVHCHHDDYVHGYVLHSHYRKYVVASVVPNCTFYCCCCCYISSCDSQWPAACLPTQ